MQPTGLLPAAPLADSSDVQARAALQSLLRNPREAGVPVGVIESVAKALLGHTDAPSGGHPHRRFRGLPHRVRVPVAKPYVLSFEQLRTLASVQLGERHTETAAVPHRVAAATREAERAAQQVAASTQAEPQRSWTRRPIAVPDTEWGECARRVVWQRAQERVTTQQRKRWVPLVAPPTQTSVALGSGAGLLTERR